MKTLQNLKPLFVLFVIFIMSVVILSGLAFTSAYAGSCPQGNTSCGHWEDPEEYWSETSCWYYDNEANENVYYGCYVNPPPYWVSNPACSDQQNNDGDSGTDINDAQCHSDGNAGNLASYLPSRDTEAGAATGTCTCASGQRTDPPNELCTTPITISNELTFYNTTSGQCSTLNTPCSDTSFIGSAPGQGYGYEGCVWEKTCTANLGNACQTSQNSCGQSNFGTIICNGASDSTCSVSAPSNTSCPAPSGSCSLTGASSITVGGSTTWTGSITDCPSGSCSYSWSDNSGAGHSGSAATFSPIFNNSGTWAASLIVNDVITGKSSAAISCPSVIVSAANVAPTANAGIDRPITLPTSSVSIPAGGATESDSDGSIASRTWTKQSGPAATITNGTTLTPTFSALTAGTYVFRLTVTDNGGLTGFDEMTVVVTSGTLTVPSCVVASGASTCTVSASWDTSNATGAYLWDRNVSATLYTANSSAGSAVWVWGGPGGTTFDLKNGNGTIFDTEIVTPSCAAGTSWNGSVCAAVVQPAPTVSTLAANSITTTGANLRGSANPNGFATTGWFRYSTANPGTCNDTFGTRTPASGGTALGSGTAASNFSRAITGLSPGTTYHFCAIASNANGTGLGDPPRSFSTTVLAIPSCSVFTVSPGSILFGSSVTVNWTCQNSDTCTEVPNSDGFATGNLVSSSDTATPTTIGTGKQYAMECDNATSAPVTVYSNFFDVVNPSATVTANPPQIDPNESTRIIGSCTDATGCRLKNASGVTVAPGTVGAGNTCSVIYDTPQLSTQTTYTLECDTGVGPVTASVVVKLRPVFEEI